MFLSWKKRDLGQATKLLNPRRGRNLGQVIIKCACVGVGQFAFRVILCNQVYVGRSRLSRKLEKLFEGKRVISGRQWQPIPEELRLSLYFHCYRNIICFEKGAQCREEVLTQEDWVPLWSGHYQISYCVSEY